MEKINLNLEGLDGNAFSILAAFQKQARREGWDDAAIKSVLDEPPRTLGGDYLILTSYSATHGTDTP